MPLTDTGIRNVKPADRPLKLFEVLLVLRDVEARGRYETARRLRSMIGRVFRLAIATDRAEVDPTLALRAPSSCRRRPRARRSRTLRG